MRGRAQSLGHRLELGRMDGAEAQGDAGLLREAALELLENACRHGDTIAPIVISVDSTAGRVALVVSSSGPAVTLEPIEADGDGSGLGIAIVQWIAAAHGGELEYTHFEGSNRFALVLRSPKGAVTITGNGR
jgi:signal transduction histidine kinase